MKKTSKSKKFEVENGKHLSNFVDGILDNYIHKVINNLFPNTTTSTLFSSNNI